MAETTAVPGVAPVPQVQQMPAPQQQVTRPASDMPVATARLPVRPMPPVQPPVTKPKSGYTGLIITAVLIVCAAISVGIYYLFFHNYIELSDQSVEKSIRVTRLLLKRGSFLAIYNVSGEKGLVPLASTTILQPELYENFNITIYNPSYVPISGDVLKAVIYHDSNNNGGFDPDTDTPVRNIFGMVESVRFKVL